MLTAVGLDVQTAENGEQAVVSFEQWGPHAVLMDMKMPVMDGYQATKEIRSRAGGEHVVVIAVSAGAWEEEKKTVLTEGADDFIRKPFREEDLLDILGNYLGIKYVYEEDGAEERGEIPPSSIREPLGSLSFENLPADLINELSEAALSLDVERMGELLQQVQVLNPVTAQAISRLLKRYDFEKLLAALQTKKVTHG